MIPLTLTENWQSFNSEVIPKAADEIQRREMRRSFYAGFLRAFEIMTGPVTEMSEDDAVKAMETINGEVIAYMRECLAAAGVTLEQAMAESEFRWVDAPEGGKPQ